MYLVYTVYSACLVYIHIVRFKALVSIKCGESAFRMFVINFGDLKCGVYKFNLNVKYIGGL